MSVAFDDFCGLPKPENGMFSEIIKNMIGETSG